jgi:c(7)-type cytochrome triheme protein
MKRRFANLLWWLLPAGLLTVSVAIAGVWASLEVDGIHDPSNPALKLLQQPNEALGVLPPDTAGNHVDWVRALQNGYIQPRSSIGESTTEEVLDLDVLMTGTGAGSVPYILFPHKPHTEWLACSNCHEHLFKSKAGATELTMLEILNGEFCGTCHGAVSFPLTECNRCHSVTPDEAREIQARTGARGEQ